MSPLSNSISEAKSGLLERFDNAYEYRSALQDLWSPPSDDESLVIAVGEFTFFKRKQPEPNTWSIAFTPTFKKSVADMDKKLQGRILAAIADLSETPIGIRGDTIKPLVGEYKGLWRYRLGDYRLVYEPCEEKHVVVLLEFGARSGVYEG